MNESVIEEMKLVAEPIGHRVCRSDRNTTVASTGSATSKRFSDHYRMSMEEQIEKAVFVGIIRQNDDDRKVMEYLDELEFLAETAGAKGDKKFVQRLDKPEKQLTSEAENFRR